MEDLLNRYRWTVLIFLFWVVGRQEVLGLDCFRVYESVDCGRSSTALNMSSYSYSLPGCNSSSCCDTNKEIRNGTKGKTSSTHSSTSNHYIETLENCQLKCDTHRKSGYSCWGYNYNYSINGVTGLCQLIYVDTPVSLVDDSLTSLVTSFMTYYRLQYCCAEFVHSQNTDINHATRITLTPIDVQTCKKACIGQPAYDSGDECWGFVQRTATVCDLVITANSSWFDTNIVTTTSDASVYVRKGACSIDVVPTDASATTTTTPSPTTTTPVTTTTTPALTTTTSVTMSTTTASTSTTDVSILPPVIENENDYERMTSDEREVVIAESIEKIKQALSVNRTSLSAYIRKKTSANDKRTSATAIGMSLGVAVLVITFGIIIISDLRILLQHIQIFFRNIRSVILM